MGGFDEKRSRRPLWRPRGWSQVLVILAVLAIGSYLSWRQQSQQRGPRPPVAVPDVSQSPALPEREQPPVATAEREVPSAPRTAPPSRDSRRTVVANQKIYDLDGEVAFRGDVDVGPTLTRIDAGRRLRFPNDGATFQNRERRLPRKPAGYYREYVHPTPGLSGPGPQRIVVGQEGETYYTPDHYRTFQRLDKP